VTEGFTEGNEGNEGQGSDRAGSATIAQAICLVPPIVKKPRLNVTNPTGDGWVDGHQVRAQIIDD
jgi:hypothetical protein